MAETMKFHEVHPGAVLKEELEARGLSANAFALKLRVPPQRIQEIVAGKRGITPETALRIGTALGTGARLWLAMQQAYDLRKGERRCRQPEALRRRRAPPAARLRPCARGRAAARSRPGGPRLGRSGGFSL